MAAVLVPFILFQRTVNPSLFLSVLFTHNASFTLSFLLVIKHINLVLVSRSWHCSFHAWNVLSPLRLGLDSHVTLQKPSLTTLPEIPLVHSHTLYTLLYFLHNIYYYLRWGHIFVASLFHHYRTVRRLGSQSFHHGTLYLVECLAYSRHSINIHRMNEQIMHCENM